MKRGRPPGFGRLEPVKLDILAMRCAGMTLQAIGDEFGVTREAIRLICKEHGVRNTTPTLMQVRRVFGAVATAARLQLMADRGGSTVEHGWARYRMGCRCDVCREANRVGCYERRWAGDVRAPHGTNSAYANYGCRCELCRAANASYQNATHRLRRMRARS